MDYGRTYVLVQFQRFPGIEVWWTVWMDGGFKVAIIKSDGLINIKSVLNCFCRNSCFRGGQMSIFRARNFTCNFNFTSRSGTQKMGAQNKSPRPIETQLEAILFAHYYLNSTLNIHFNAFPSKIFVMRLL